MITEYLYSNNKGRHKATAATHIHTHSLFPDFVKPAFFVSGHLG